MTHEDYLKSRKERFLKSIERIRIQDYFRTQVIVGIEDETLRIISPNEREYLSNLLLSELTSAHITLKGIDLYYTYDDEESGEYWSNCTLWEFAPIDLLIERSW